MTADNSIERCLFICREGYHPIDWQSALEYSTDIRHDDTEGMWIVATDGEALTKAEITAGSDIHICYAEFLQSQMHSRAGSERYIPIEFRCYTMWDAEYNNQHVTMYPERLAHFEPDMVDETMWIVPVLASTNKNTITLRFNTNG